MILLMSAVCIVQAIHPDPTAVNSPSKVFFVFMLPISLGIMPVVILVNSFLAWRSQAKYHGLQEAAVSQELIAFTGVDGRGTVAWTRYKFYKETPWSFIVWQGFDSMMFPKRAFSSREDLHRFRDLLGQRLQRSRWFFG
jgi:hypothetical protein